MPSACFAAIGNVQRITQHAKGMSLRYGVIVLGNLIRFFTKKSFYNQGEWIEVRFMVLISGFQHLVGDHLFGGKINWERRKMQIHAPLNIVKMHWWSEFYPTKTGKNADLSLYLQSPKLTNPHEYDTKTNTGKANIRKVEKFLQPPYSARENHSRPTPPAPDCVVCGAAHIGHTRRLAGGVGVVRHLL